jgi:hypothetical protein
MLYCALDENFDFDRRSHDNRRRHAIRRDVRTDEPDREPAEIPSELLAALQKDLNEDKDVKACLEEPDNPPLKGQVAASWLDLDLNSPHCF